MKQLLDDLNRHYDLAIFARNDTEALVGLGNFPGYVYIKLVDERHEAPKIIPIASTPRP
jgi:hypothetical protein